MGINEIIMYIMMFFMLIAAVDRILSQFGGSARFLGKFGKSIEGSGGQFEEGFMAMGALGLAMVGMTALAPVLAHVLGPVIIPVYEMLGANPSMFAGTLLACDMGGFFLAKELAGGDVAAWLYSGLILGSMMGPTIVFSIPVALGIIEPSDRRYLALGSFLMNPVQSPVKEQAVFAVKNVRQERPICFVPVLSDTLKGGSIVLPAREGQFDVLILVLSRAT